MKLQELLDFDAVSEQIWAARVEANPDSPATSIRIGKQPMADSGAMVLKIMKLVDLILKMTGLGGIFSQC
jgi:hypothetical protein